MLNYIIWNVNPEAFAIGNFAVRWYGLLWALGFLVGYKIVEKEFKHENLNLEWLDSLFMYIFLGSVIGARIGHCLFYEWSYYSAHPLEILYVWKGGLASHGGAIGLLIALYIYNKRISKKGYVWLFDHIVIAVAFAGFCIRLGNLMNSEIYGTPTDLPWGFKFVRDHALQPVENIPACHPTQIYEMTYCLVTFAVCTWLYQRKKAYTKNGLIFGTFLIGIFLSRFLLEFIKNNQEEFENDMMLNMGQWLSVPFIIWGFYLIIRAMKKNTEKI